MKNYIKPGRVITLIAAPYARLAGEGVQMGKMFGVCVSDIGNGLSGEIETEGVFALAKAGSQAWTQGAAIYWDNTAKVCTTVVSTNLLIGHANGVVGAGAGETVGEVRLHGASF